MNFSSNALYYFCFSAKLRATYLNMNNGKQSNNVSKHLISLDILNKAIKIFRVLCKLRRPWQLISQTFVCGLDYGVLLGGLITEITLVSGCFSSAYLNYLGPVTSLIINNAQDMISHDDLTHLF